MGQGHEGRGAPGLRRVGSLIGVARYLVDTNVLIDLSKGVPPVGARLDALLAAGHELGVCAVNLAEFIAGVPVEVRPKWEQWLGRFAYWDITREAAVEAGVYRRVFRRQGVTLSTPDALVAGLATTLQATILTDNAKDFPMSGIRIVSLKA